MKKSIACTFILFALLISNNAYSQDAGALTAELEPRTETKRSKERPSQPAPMTRPQFPGGQKGMSKYLVKSVQYPAIAAEYGIEGKVIVAATVTEDGQITNARVTNSAFSEFNKEAIAAVMQMPKWKPGTKNGIAVPTPVMLEIKFSLQ